MVAEEKEGSCQFLEFKNLHRCTNTWEYRWSFGTPKRLHLLPLIDSINARLSAWKAKFLSFAGRLILIKCVLSSIPINIALVLPLPTSTCKGIKRLMRNFLWTGNASSSKPNYVGLRYVFQKPKVALGLERLLKSIIHVTSS